MTIRLMIIIIMPNRAKWRKLFTRGTRHKVFFFKIFIKESSPFPNGKSTQH
jgi:hypothetical protein